MHPIMLSCKKRQKISGYPIIGVSGRYPKAENLEQFWLNLRDGRDCITEIPKDRWDNSQYLEIIITGVVL